MERFLKSLGLDTYNYEYVIQVTISPVTDDVPEPPDEDDPNA